MLKRLICALIGHNWQEHPFTANLRTAAPFVECSRCPKKGWLL